MGPVDAKVVVVEFADFECPVCRTFMSTTMVPFLRDHPDEAALVFRHWPLSYHRFAYPAARASECAAAQGRFVTYHDLLYEYQDSLGLKPFREMAQEAGVLELAQFDECIARTEQVTRIEDDIAEAQTRGGSGTPTIFVNGYRYLGMPTRQQLDSILDVARMGANQ
jgi:protein-disulfide isomerase